MEFLDNFWKSLEDMSRMDKRRLYLMAKRCARALNAPDMSAEDLIHEAYIAVATGRRRWPPDVPLIAVLIMTMRGLAWNHRKARHHTCELIEDVDFVPHAKTPEEVVGDAEVLKIFCESLGTEERAIVNLVLGGMTTKKEISSLNSPKLRKALQRKIKTFRDRLAGDLDKDAA